MTLDKKVFFIWVENPRSERLLRAQRRLEASIVEHGLSPVRLPAGRKLSLLGEVLSEARKQTVGSAFVWVNSDVIVTRDLFDVPERQIVFGYHRREVPSGSLTLGVDGYYIPLRWWDEYLCKDIPRLYVGAGYVDWWISRAMQKRGAYRNLVGYLDHPSHPRSNAACSDADSYYQKNFRAYNAWAQRNHLDPIPAPPYLMPFVGHTWGARHLLRKLLERHLEKKAK